ncbi:hypothetical protein [Paracoccus sp. (in: a-proteobacteria)]|uniref:hypothetical protein n=1 Tax=Paracoccus sp. TaxID=267 RepID=UPI0035B05573
MQHEMMRQPAPVHGSDKVGDVLASIRRLIAQDEAAAPIPNQMLNTLPRDAAAAGDAEMADIAPENAAQAMDAWTPQDVPETAPAETAQAETAQAEPLPLVLNSSNLIAPGVPETSAETAAAAEPAPKPQLWTTPLTSISEIETAVEPAPELAPETASETAPDPLPEPILPEEILAEEILAEAIVAEPPEVALAPFPSARPEFNIDALWADLPDTDEPASGLASGPDSPDSAGPETPAQTMDDTAPYSLNLMQTEENMLQANASVTPINPHIDPGILAEIETQRDGGEPHLFAPQDKGAQKGTHLRGMIREAIRQELQGEIGNRLSRNLQQMIRHEIELTLRQMCEQE